MAAGSVATAAGVATAEPARSGCSRGAFRHELLVHEHGVAGFVAQLTPIVEESLDAGAPVLVAVRPERIEALREELGARAEQVGFADMLELGANPARIIPAWRRFLAEHRDSPAPALGVGEPIWPGRSAAELSECERHESLLNLAFRDGQPWRLVCPYDVEALADEVIERTRHSHPYVAGPQRSAPSVEYWRDHDPARPFAGELPAAPPQARTIEFGRGDLAELRHLLAGWAAEHLLVTDSSEELVLAVDEIATNSVCYGGGGGTLRIWREPDAVLCEVQDDGHIQAPLAGRIEPDPDARCGRGLWIANHLCDLVQIRSSPRGTTVRLHKRLR